MKLPFALLAGLVVYFIWASTFVDLTRDLVESLSL
jgi:hypothetical protein